jgi:hypothetical protein
MNHAQVSENEGIRRMSTVTTQWPAVPLRIKKVTLWRREITAHPDVFADALTLLTEGGMELPVILRYRHPTDARRAFIEVYPLPADHDDTWPAYLRGIGFAPRHVPVLMIESEHFAGDGHSLTKLIANLRVNIMFLATQIINGKCGATIGFESDADAEKAVDMFRRMTAATPELEEFRKSAQGQERVGTS